jgi:hypothetical protein
VKAIYKLKTDEIKIKITGTKAFRQAMIDAIYVYLMHGEVKFKGPQGGNSVNLESSIAPSEELWS